MAAVLPRPLLAVTNVTAHPSTAGVAITVLLYDGPLLCGFNVAIKELNTNQPTDLVLRCVPRDKLNVLIESFYKDVEKLRDAAIQVITSHHIIKVIVPNHTD